MAIDPDHIYEDLEEFVSIDTGAIYGYRIDTENNFIHVESYTDDGTVEDTKTFVLNEVKDAD